VHLGIRIEQQVMVGRDGVTEEVPAAQRSEEGGFLNV
jgi:hypothetical protein